MKRNGIFAALAAGGLAVAGWAQQAAPAAAPQAPQQLPAPEAKAAPGKKPGPVNVRITVEVANAKGEPISDAGVVLLQTQDAKGFAPKNAFNVELRTDRKGQVVVQGFQPGKVSVQVIAKGYQTWGKVLPMENSDEKVDVTLALPKPQISIYGQGGGGVR